MTLKVYPPKSLTKQIIHSFMSAVHIFHDLKMNKLTMPGEVSLIS